MKRGIAILIAALLLAGCSPPKDKADGSPVLARVNGLPITAKQFEERLALAGMGFQNLSGHVSPAAEAKADLLGQMVEDEMHIQEARRLNLSASDQEVADRLKKIASDYPGKSFEKTLASCGLDLASFRRELGKKLAVEKLLKSQVYSKIRVSDSETLAYYKDHKSDFSRPARVRARQIVVDNPADAKLILEQLRRGSDFAALARSRSLSPDGATGGDLGYFSKGDMPREFESAIFRLKPGGISPVVKSPYGYHVFRLEDIQKPRDLTYEQALPEIKNKVASERAEGAFAAWQEALKTRTKIDINFDVLGGL